MERLISAPMSIRIELRQGSGARGGVGSEVLLVHDALVVDKEGHDPRVGPSRRIGHQREAAEHFALYHIVIGAAGGIGALACEDAIVVAMIGQACADLPSGITCLLAPAMRGPSGLSSSPSLVGQKRPSRVPFVLRNFCA